MDLTAANSYNIIVYLNLQVADFQEFRPLFTFSSCTPLQCSFDSGEKRAHFHRLCDVIVRAELQANHFVNLAISRCEENYRSLCSRRILPYRFADLPSIEFWHHDIEHDKVWMLLDNPESFFPVVCGENAIAFLLEVVLQQLENVSFVIDEQNGGRHAMSGD